MMQFLYGLMGVLLVCIAAWFTIPIGTGTGGKLNKEAKIILAIIGVVIVITIALMSASLTEIA